MTCKNCGGLILQPGATYGINPNSVCRCGFSSELTDKQKMMIEKAVKLTVEKYGETLKRLANV